MRTLLSRAWVTPAPAASRRNRCHAVHRPEVLSNWLACVPPNSCKQLFSCHLCTSHSASAAVFSRATHSGQGVEGSLWEERCIEREKMTRLGRFRGQFARLANGISVAIGIEWSASEFADTQKELKDHGKSGKSQRDGRNSEGRGPGQPQH